MHLPDDWNQNIPDGPLKAIYSRPRLWKKKIPKLTASLRGRLLSNRPSIGQTQFFEVSDWLKSSPPPSSLPPHRPTHPSRGTPSPFLRRSPILPCCLTSDCCLKMTGVVSISLCSNFVFQTLASVRMWNITIGSCQRKRKTFHHG